ncbi:uncharacterized protein LOC100163384 [Acyrthosiphon pisum]|uniref:Uncharacterized protein n=1 Tax=Acyrthosiphon pisum TaxID=7029 RepID=A0A8R2A1B8_ACYPI|nr:uncharacterized protein LOC100163384 [Acyrthosiphon pisum]|eukprot:XP_001942640.1 PREDICTED: uncharacterized protein LOC100163384 [Acyrthosiphon pisum]
MCMPADHGDAAVISYVDFFAATPVQPLPPTRPPYQHHLTLRHQRPIPLAVVPESSESAPENNATTVAVTPKRAQRTLRCTCHNKSAAMRLGAKRHVTATDDVTLSIRLFITLSIAILATKLIADAVYSTGVDCSLVDNPHSYRAKRQLPPIEQGNMVIDSIFQIPIKTLSAVGTLIKTARPLVRRTRERIQQYYTGYQQQYSNGQQQYSNGQQQYGNGQQQYGNGLQQYGNSLQQYNNGQQYYTSGKKRYSIGRLNTDQELRQDDGGEEFVHRPKRTQVTYRVSNDQPEGRHLYKSEVY